MSFAIASVSWGKDSLAMLHGLIERGMPLDEVVFYDTGMEFDAIYRERDRILPLLRENGIRYVELKPAMSTSAATDGAAGRAGGGRRRSAGRSTGTPRPSGRRCTSG